MKTFIAQPVVTEKSLALAAKGEYQFFVPTWATKEQIAAYLARHFTVTVATVRTARVDGRAVQFRRRWGRRSRQKKATVKLTLGQTIASFNLAKSEKDGPAPREEKGQKSAPTKEAPPQAARSETRQLTRPKDKGQ